MATSTLVSWAIVLALGALAAWHYSGRPDVVSKLLPPTQPSLEAIEPKVLNKSQKSKRPSAVKLASSENRPSTASQSSEHINKKRKTATSIVSDGSGKPEKTAQKVTSSGDGDDGLTNKEFATQLAKTQAGAKIDSSSQSGPSKKERRATKVATASHTNKDLDHSALSTGTSSTTGAEDDDRSLLSSPRSEPVSTAATSRAGDISDMLEPAAPKPMTMKITAVGDSAQKQTQSKSKKEYEVAQTKKQRYNQRKREEAALAVLQSNTAHDAKKQQQLRVSRMAEGTSAQTKTDAFKPPPQSVWKKINEQPNLNVSQPSTVNDLTPLLDTIDSTTRTDAQDSKPAQSANAVPRVNSSAPPFSTKQEEQPSWADEISNEELRWINQDKDVDASWKPVVGKKGKKKDSKKENDTGSDTSASVSRPATKTAVPTTNGTQPKAGNPNRFNAIETKQQFSGDFQDSDWTA